MSKLIISAIVIAVISSMIYEYYHAEGKDPDDENF